MRVSLAVALWLVGVVAHEIDFYDCSTPTQAKVVSKTELCQENPNQGGVSEQVAILQRREVRLMRGYSCQLKRSATTFRCSVWSHFKLALPPTVMQTTVLSR